MLDPFWLYLGCFVIAVGGIFAVEAFQKNERHGLIRATLCLMLIACLVLIAKGAIMAIGWVNPFEGKSQEIARVIHGPRSGVIILALSVWPYLLMAIGGFFGFVSVKLLRNKSRSQLARQRSS